MLLAAYRYGGYGFYFDPTYFLVVIGLLLSLWASSVVNSTFNKYSKVRCMSNLSGAEAARKVLDSCGLYNDKLFDSFFVSIIHSFFLFSVFQNMFFVFQIQIFSLFCIFIHFKTSFSPKRNFPRYVHLSGT